MSDSIKLVNAALDELGSEIVMRGAIDPVSLKSLKVDSYQRDIEPMSTIRELAAALRVGGVPDIQLGMRGGSFQEEKTRGSFLLTDQVYIIDGLQRRTAALEIMKSGEIPHLGATVYFNTTFPKEQEMFRAFNMFRSKLSPNVLIRNEQHNNDFIKMLVDLCKDSTFVLHHKVCWNQRMKREELIKALGLLKVAGRIHSRFRTGLLESNHYILSGNMLKVMQRLGRNVVRNNIKTFWQVLDEVFNVRNVTYKESSPHLRQSFLMMLARVYADHQDFWKDAELRVPVELKRKISTFPLEDPHVFSLCSAAGPSMDILYNMIIQHINSGKRLHRLTPFILESEADEQEDGTEEDDVS
jgi:hypothetical protein